MHLVRRQISIVVSYSVWICAKVEEPYRVYEGLEEDVSEHERVDNNQPAPKFSSHFTTFSWVMAGKSNFNVLMFL